MPWLLDEDRALKEKLSGIKVGDAKAPAGGRLVETWFRYPESEQRPIKYPFIVIDFLGVREALDREHRGVIKPRRVPTDVPPAPAGQVLTTEFPTPVDLQYQISTFARSQAHDAQLLITLLTDPSLLPYKFGFLAVDVDDTVRRLDVVSATPAPMLDEQGKRVFRNVFTINVSSEIFTHQISLLYTVSSVTLRTTPLDRIIVVEEPAQP